MKKVKFESKLSLNKETIAKLNQNQMQNLKGGANGKDNEVLFLSIFACHSRKGCNWETL
jgi:natural product precursor